MRNYLIIFTILQGALISLHAQSVMTTPSGQQILVYSDFSYEIIANSQLHSPFQVPKDGNINLRRQVTQQHQELLKLEANLFIENTKTGVEKQNSTKMDDLVADIKVLENFLNGTNDEVEAIENIIEKYGDVSNIRTYQARQAPKVNQIPMVEIPPCVKQTIEHEIIKQEVITTNTSQLLTFTPQRLINYYKNRDYLNINASVFEDNKEDIYVELECVFHSKDIEKSYGSVLMNDFVRITFINQKSVFLKPYINSKASIQSYTGNTIYRIILPIKYKEDLNMIKSKMIDNIGIMWTSGFEQYPVYNVDFFKEKMDCLNDNN